VEIEFKPLMPKKPIVNAQAVYRGLAQEMYRFVTELRKKIAKYPPDQPTVSGYRRTTALGRSWSPSVERKPALIIGRVTSDPTVMTRTPHQRRLKSGGLSKPWFPKKSYAPYVVGKRQSRLMAGRGWKKVGDILKKEWPGQVRRFQGVINRSR